MKESMGLLSELTLDAIEKVLLGQMAIGDWRLAVLLSSRQPPTASQEEELKIKRTGSAPFAGSCVRPSALVDVG